jgi:hypothetical protein
MALFATPQEHAANPPETWVVVKRGPRSWALTLNGDTTAVLDRFETKRAAEQARTEGFLVRLYRQEARWYAGEPVPGWRPYSA